LPKKHILDIMDLLNAVGIEHELLIFADDNGDMGRGTD
jgi:hypothetical protein